jgi:pSer/pThr/pTyr-binding forkhead associated (FHA) protein
MRFQIRHLSGSKAGQEEILEGKVITIGRDPSSNLAFDPHQDDRVSTNHAQLLVQDNGQVLLTDLGSSNGTFIGEQKVTAPIPLMTGAMVTFGDGGPQVSIVFLPPEAPAAPPPEPPKKSKAPLIVIGLVAVLGLVCVIGVVVSLMGDDESEVSAGDPDAPPAEGPAEDPPAEDPPAEDPPADTAGDPPAEDPPAETQPADDKVETAWAKVGVGSVFEFKSVTDMEVAGNKMTTEVTIKYTVKEKTDTEAVVTMETVIPNVPPQTNEQRFPLVAEVTEGESETEAETKEESIEVPAGSFDCTYTKTTTTTNGQETVSEVWLPEDFPLPVKSVTKAPTSTTTMELVSLDKK